ncbi:hypothetical protein FUT84_10620 [Treponema phagedenis]|nr:hypothetical protein FUT84_10620 [Treponema phagedenis]QEK04202.1 hypothetical protein FUT83_10540 [Treponema phagedenis]
MAKLYLASFKAFINYFALKHRCCLEPRASVPVLSFDVLVKIKSASFKASILQFCTDAFKHRLNLF